MAIYPEPNVSKRDLQHRISPYLLRKLSISGPDHVWSVDISFIRMKHGWMYLYHFTSPKYIELLHEHEVLISMDGKGRATDNIATERFWRSLNYNEIYFQDYQSPRENRQGIERYIHLHNRYLSHQSLHNHTPEAVYTQALLLPSTSE
ncbi:hypothetical protein [Paenibacillus sp. NRS-1760]|uniref:hypothetical protein n=1 Tax=Paenibacillus sp. NRS-1760 TaxID=3233902 RepID=UPI003D26CDED